MGEPPERQVGHGTGGVADRFLAGMLVIIVVLAGAWFLLSWRVMGSSIPDALGESVGVAFGLLIVVSVVGAARSGPRGR